LAAEMLGMYVTPIALVIVLTLCLFVTPPVAEAQQAVKTARVGGSPSAGDAGDLHDRRNRGTLCTRAAALSQVQQPAG